MSNDHRSLENRIQEMLDGVLDDPSQNERERLLEIARRFYEERLLEEPRED